MRLMWALMPIYILAMIWAPVDVESSRDSCKQGDFSVCKDVSLLTETEEPPSEHQESILKELCNAGHAHRVRRGHGEEQFAVMNIHNDKNNNTVNWYGGEAGDVMCKTEWRVDANMSLRTGSTGKGGGAYKWYSHGIPMWPILDQCLKKSRWSIIPFLPRFKIKWPNYAIAMPLYLIDHECRRYRDPLIAMRKLFHHEVSTFSKLRMLKAFVEKVMKNIRDAQGTKCPIPIMIEDYSKWLQPFISESLVPMMTYAKKSNPTKCPDELYVFIRNKPNLNSAAAKILDKDLVNVLETVKCCNKTSLVVGYLTRYYDDKTIV